MSGSGITIQADTDVAVVLGAARRGDPDAWEEIVRRYQHVVLGTIARFRLGAADSADVAQTTWLRLIERGGAIREADKLGGWLATTARRECLAVLKRRRGEAPLTGWVGDEPACPGPTPESAAVAADTRRVVRAAAAELTGRAAQIIKALFFDEPASYAELSSRLGVPVGSIGPTRARAVEALRPRLQDLGT